MAARKKYTGKGRSRKGRNGSKGSHLVKQTPEQKILEHLLSIKQQVLEREVLPFDVGRFARMPHNAFTQHQYGGFYNLLMIMMSSFVKGWDDPRFVTVGKAKEIGAEFKGERTTMLWAPVFIKELNEDTGKEEVVAVRFRTFRVFNATQFANLAELDIPPLQKSTWGDTPVMERIEAVKEHALTNFNIEPTFVEMPFIPAPHYKPGSAPDCAAAVGGVQEAGTLPAVALARADTRDGRARRVGTLQAARGGFPRRAEGRICLRRNGHTVCYRVAARTVRLPARDQAQRSLHFELVQGH